MRRYATKWKSFSKRDGDLAASRPTSDERVMVETCSPLDETDRFSLCCEASHEPSQQLLLGIDAPKDDPSPKFIFG